MDKSGSVSPLPRFVKILIWLAQAFVLEARERKTQLIFNTRRRRESSRERRKGEVQGRWGKEEWEGSGR